MDPFQAPQYSFGASLQVSPFEVKPPPYDEACQDSKHPMRWRRKRDRTSTSLEEKKEEEDEVVEVEAPQAPLSSNDAPLALSQRKKQRVDGHSCPTCQDVSIQSLKDQMTKSIKALRAVEQETLAQIQSLRKDLESKSEEKKGLLTQVESLKRELEQAFQREKALKEKVKDVWLKLLNSQKEFAQSLVQGIEEIV